jgi:hypothetical protein
MSTYYPNLCPPPGPESDSLPDEVGFSDFLSPVLRLSGLQPNTSNPFRASIIRILQSPSPSLGDFNTLLEGISNQEQKLHAIQCEMSEYNHPLFL